MRAVLDVNVLISAMLSPAGAPADTLRAWRAGRYELIVSPRLLTELERALRYPRIVRRLPVERSSEVVALIASDATVADDVGDPPPRSRDPQDDYLLALAEDQVALLVSGDLDLLALSDTLPVLAPAAFVTWLERHADPD